MHEHDGGRRRCTECRCWFAPAASAVRTQRVCGAKCRASRRRKLARSRRSRHVQDSRVDERKRQRERRQRRRAVGCHALASAPKPAEIKAELLDSWDRAAALSRASLQRRLPGILRAIVRSEGTAAASGGPLSRATLAPQVAGSARD